MGRCLQVVFVISASLQAAQLTIEPPTVSDQYSEPIVIGITGLSPGHSVRVEAFSDRNGNGAANPDDPLLQSFQVTDGVAPSVGGIRNPNIPGDVDGAANGVVRIEWSLLAGSEGARMAGAYVFLVSSLGTGFVPVAGSLIVTREPAPQAITGVVRSANGSPIPRATVVLLDQSFAFGGGVAADASGYFRLDVAPGAYWVTAFQDGFVGSFLSTPSAVVTPNQDTAVEIALNSTERTVSGKIVDAGTGQGIPGMMITFGSEEPEVGTSLGFSDREGNFVLNTGAGAAALRPSEYDALRLGYLIPDDSDVDTSAGNVADVKVALIKATALIWGTIQDDLGNPLAGLFISAEADADASEGAGVSMSPNGSYAIGVTSGIWRVSPAVEDVARLGLTCEGSTVSLVDGEAVRVDLKATRPTVHLRGLVMDETGSVLGNLTLHACPQQFSGNPCPKTEAGWDGRFDFGLSGGVWNLFVSSEVLEERGLIAPRLTFSMIDGIDQDGIEIRLRAVNRRITGSLKDAAESGIPDLAIYASATVAGSDYNTDTRTDGAGNFELGVFDGDWRVGVVASDLQLRGFLPIDSQSVTIAGGNRRIDFSLNTHSAHLRGRVVRADQSPASQIRVAAYNDSGDSDSMTDENGNFDIGITAGTWTVQPDPQELTQRGLFAPSLSYTVAEGMDVNDIEIVLRTVTASIRVSLADDTGNPLSNVFLSAFTEVNGTHYRIGEFTGADGTVVLPVFCGPWRIWVDCMNLQSLGADCLEEKPIDICNTDISMAFTAPRARALQIITTSLPEGTRDEEYSFALTAAEGRPPYQWTIAAESGPPPIGLTLDPDGLISGRLGEAGMFDVTVRVTDTTQRTAARTLSLFVKEPSSDRWILRASMPTPRANPVAVTMGGLIYVAGGLISSSSALSVMEVYDPLQNTWTPAAPLPTARSGAAAAVINDKLYVAGGYEGETTLEVYDPSTDQWTSLQSMSTGRNGAAAGAIDGKLYVVGDSGDFTRTLEMYDPATDRWTVKAPMPTPRHDLTAGVVNGELYALGGNNAATGRSDVVEVYNPVTDTWSRRRPMPTARAGMATAVLDDRICVIGGISSAINEVTDLAIYEPNSDHWTTGAPLSRNRQGLTAVGVSGRLFAIGGVSWQGAPPFVSAPLAFVEEHIDTTLDSMMDIVLTSDEHTLAAGLAWGAPSAAVLDRLDRGDATGVTFAPGLVGSFGSLASIPPYAPGGTRIVNIPPGDGQNGFFKFVFFLPEQFPKIQLHGAANIDDLGRVFLNGNPLSPPLLTPLSSTGPFRITPSGNGVFAASGRELFQPGANELLFATLNAAGGPSGGAFYAVISYEPAAPTGLSIPKIFADRTVQLDLSGQPGHSYTIQASSDLIQWIELTSTNLSSPVLRWTDPQAGQFPYRFYRAVEGN